MPEDRNDTQDELAEQLHLYRDRLVWLCGYLSGSHEAAEDLAQETLAEAWRLRHRLYDAEGLLFWLSAIARNICSRWRRERARTGTGAECPLPPEHEHPGSAYDIELELEHGELSHLLDCALTHIPADTRQVLIQQFIEGASQAEIADELGLSVGAVKLRVHRGKQVLRRVLETELRRDAIAFGLVAPGAEPWEETRVWCPYCGQHRLRGIWTEGRGRLSLRCPGCNPGADDYCVSMSGAVAPGPFEGVQGFKAGYSRALRWTASYLPSGARTAWCLGCGAEALARQGVTDGLPSRYQHHPATHSYVQCPSCGGILYEMLSGRILALPEVRRFWQRHGHIRLRPEEHIEAAGMPAVVTSFEAVTDSSSIDVVTLRDHFQIVSISAR